MYISLLKFNISEDRNMNTRVETKLLPQPYGEQTEEGQIQVMGGSGTIKEWRIWWIGTARSPARA